MHRGIRHELTAHRLRMGRLLWAALLTVAATGLRAQAVTVLYDLATGKLPDGSLTALYALDDDWEIVTAPSSAYLGPARVIFPNGAWFTATPDAQWISTSAILSGLSDVAPGEYTYRYTFALDTAQYTDFVISAEYGADNLVSGMFLNGTPVSGFTSGNYTTPYGGSVTISDPALFVSGTNTFDVVVRNTTTNANPSGFVLRGTVTGNVVVAGDVAVPEPRHAVTFTIAAFLALHVLRRRAL